MVSEIVSFPPEVIDQLGFYVYRLIDPRTGETFYVGKGKGNRVFSHVAGNVGDEPENEKISRIRQISNAGLAVQHVIHRHGLDSRTALEIEAALMDAYPGVSNIAGGHGSADYGVAHAKEIVERYHAKDADIDHPCIEIIVRRSSTERSLYDATRFSWRVSKSMADKARYALAVENGLILKVFEIDEWLLATAANFPGLADPDVESTRWGFVGREAGKDIQDKYVRKKVPKRERGAANPIRYHCL